MKRISRLAFTVASALALSGTAGVVPAAADPGCGGLCSVDGGYSVTATRISPCANFGGNVCYNLTWHVTVRGSSLVAGSYTATSNPDYGTGYSGACLFISPATTSCSGSGSTYAQIVPPNSTTCHSWSSTLSNGVSTVATDSGSSCRSVGS